METQMNYSKTGSLNIYMQQALRPLRKRFLYAKYVNSLALKKTDKVLEFGSGIGAMAELMAEKLDDGQLTCIDISNRYLTLAKRNLRDYPNVTFLKGRLVDVRIDEGFFDAVNIHFVLHNVPKSNRSVILSQMCAILRHGGKVFIREPLKKTNGLSIDEMQKLFRSAGFCPLFQREEKIKIYGDVITACYAKISSFRFYLS